EGAFVRLGTTSDEELAVVRLVAREALLSSARFRKVLSRMQRGHIALLASTLAEGVRVGDLDGRWPLPILLVSTMGLGALPQFVRRAVGGEAPFVPLPSAQDLAKTSVELLFGAVGRRAARGAPESGPESAPESGPESAPKRKARKAGGPQRRQ